MVREKVIELAAKRGVDARAIADADSLIDDGVLDSVALLELVMWVETEFNLTVLQADLNIENFGTVQAVADYLSTQLSR